MDGFKEEFPSLIINSPFLFKNKPSILSKYCFCVNVKVYSKLESDAGVLETIPPVPVNDLVLEEDNNELFWNPDVIESLSTFGLKSSTSDKDTLPKAGELKDGISSGPTPASCK